MMKFKRRKIKTAGARNCGIIIYKKVLVSNHLPKTLEYKQHSLFGDVNRQRQHPRVAENASNIVKIPHEVVST